MLSVGDTHVKTYTVEPGHTVPDILPESPEFQALPDVFTTGCLLAIMEWACIEHLLPHMEQGRISLGVGMDMTHDAPCTTGTELEIDCTVTDVSPKRFVWEVEVRAKADGTVMGRGKHTRAVVPREKFSAMVNERTGVIGGEQLRQP